MPSGITETDGMSYVGREPWHGLGTLVAGQAMTAAEAIEAASLNWAVSLEEVYTNRNDDENGYQLVEGKKAVVRSDTDAVLAIVGNRYTPAQNTIVFDFLDSIVGTGDAVYQTAGSLFGGRRVFLLAKLLGDYVLDNGEALDSYILLDNSHDGTSSLRMRFTKIRVVCANTLEMATQGRAAFSARHTGGIIERVTSAREMMGLNAAHMQRFMAECNMLAQEQFSTDDMHDLTYDLLGLDRKRLLDDQKGARSAVALKLVDLFHSGVGNSGETRWDAFNAVAEFVDYYRPRGNQVESLNWNDEATQEARLENSWFARGGENLRSKALRVLSRV